MSVCRRLAAIALFVACATAAPASETVSYTYDALGRLVVVSRAGTVNNGASESYSYDSSDNRTNVSVTPGTPTTCSGISFSIVSNGPVTEGASSVFTITRSGSTS